jgi:hypothetical protein
MAFAQKTDHSSDQSIDDVCDSYIERQKCYGSRHERDDTDRVNIGKHFKHKSTTEMSTKIEVDSIDTVQCVQSTTTTSYGMLSDFSILIFMQ